MQCLELRSWGMVAEDANPFPVMLGAEGTKVGAPHTAQDLLPQGKAGSFAQFSWGQGWETLRQGREPWSKHTGIGARHLAWSHTRHWSQHRLRAQPGTGTGFGSRGVDDSERGRMWKMQPGHNAT